MSNNMFTVDMKSLTQEIKNPTVGAGNANGMGMRIIFSQMADKAFSEETQVYLKGMHQQTGVQGYDAFYQVSRPSGGFHPGPDYCPPPGYYPPPPPPPRPPKGANVGEIKGPRQMLREGDVTCTVELVDSVSIVSTNNFIVHVLKSPHDGEHFIPSDDYTIFQEAVIALNNTMRDAKHMMRRMREEFQGFERQIDNIEDIADGAKKDALDVSNRLKQHIELSDTEHQRIINMIEELQTTVTNNKTETDAAIESLSNSLVALSQTVQDNKQELDAKDATLEEQIALAQSTLEGSIEALGTVVQQLSSTLEEHQRISDEKFLQVDGEISSMRADITEIQDSADTTSQEIADLKTALAEAMEITELI